MKNYSTSSNSINFDGVSLSEVYSTTISDNAVGIEDYKYGGIIWSSVEPQEEILSPTLEYMNITCVSKKLFD